MGEKRDYTQRVLLYDPMFDEKMRNASESRYKSKWKRAVFVIVIVASVLASIYFSFYSLERDRYAFKETENGIMLSQFSGRETDKVLYIDYLRDKDGNQPDTSKPVTQVREYAINCNEYLRFIYISKTVEKIESTSFFTVNNLYGVFVEEGNEHYGVVDGVLYELENGQPVKAVFSPAKRAYVLAAEAVGAAVPQSAEQVEAFLKFCEENTEEIDAVYEEYRYTVDLPDTVKVVGHLAFAYNEKLRRVVLHEGIVELEEMALFRCSQMETVDFPSTLQKIGSDALSFCGEVKYIYIPAGVTEIGHHAFYNCGAEQVHMELSEEEADKLVDFGDAWMPKKRKVIMKAVPVLYNQEKEVS